MKGTNVECPGCKVLLPNQGLGLDERYNAIGECVSLYGELTAYTIMKQDITFIHQLVVDAYAAQHVGKTTKNITTVYSLVGLYLVNEHRFSGRQVQQAHMKLSKYRIKWPYFEPPKHTCDIHVFRIMNTDEGDQRDEMIKKWSEGVWMSWEHKHEWVRNICREYELLLD